MRRLVEGGRPDRRGQKESVEGRFFQALGKKRAGSSKAWKKARGVFQALENRAYLASPEDFFSAVKVPEPSMNENLPSVICVPSSLNLPCQLIGTLLIFL